MNVLWIHSGGWLSHAAISYVGVHSAWAFAEAGATTRLLMPAAHEDDFLETGLAGHYGLDPHAGLSIERLTQRRRWWHLHHPTYRHAEAAAREWRRRLPPDEPLLVLSREPRFLPYLARLARLPGVVALYESHYLYLDLSWRQGPVSRGDRLRGEMERRYLPQISGLICIASEQEKLFQERVPGLPTLFSPLGTKVLAPSQTSAGQEEAWRQRRTLAYIGHLHAYKGVDALVAYSGRLRQHGIRAAFFGGTEPEVARYRELCRQQGADNLSWYPFLPPARMFDALAESASVGIVALQDSFYNRHLTCPVKALDFLSLGLPVAASDLPCTRDVLGQAGQYFPPDQLDRMLDQVVNLLDDPAAYAASAAAARQRAAALAWPERARQILAFADSLR